MALPVVKLKAQNFLSLRDVEVTFGALNVLVGPNGAGKSNLLQVFEFLGEVARYDLVPAVERAGGFDALRFGGEIVSDPGIILEFEGNVSRYSSVKAPDRYKLSFLERKIRSRTKESTREVNRYISRSEEITLKRTKGRGRRITLNNDDIEFDYEGIRPKTAPGSLKVQESSSGLATLRRLGRSYGADQVEAIARAFEGVRLYEIDVASVRQPSAVRESDMLAPDASNLAAFLLWLSDSDRDAFDLLIEDVRFVLPSFRAFEFQTIGGADDAIRLALVEEHRRKSTPLARASFGTIRAIALFAMLHDPNPPTMTLLEEVDHGLHPHALDRVVDRLREASERTQIIAATHSPALVNRLREDELIVVQREEEFGGSDIFRPDKEVIAEMQKDSDYGLGEIWFSGAIGGAL